MEKEIEFEASLYFFRAVKVSDEQKWPSDMGDFVSDVRGVSWYYCYKGQNQSFIIKFKVFSVFLKISITSSSSDESTLSDDSEVKFISIYVYRHIEYRDEKYQYMFEPCP
jgi:hypothetical protein